MAAKTLLEVKNISQSYGSHDVLQDISFRLHAGDQLAIIGPSGSGKSTLINILLKSIPYDKGEVIVDGRAIEDYEKSSDYAKKIGVVRQQYDLVNELEVIHNVLAGNLHRWTFFQSLSSLIRPREKDLALDALKKVGIESKAFHPTSRLSGGEQQRVAIARLIVQDPDIFVADEPIASLDQARANQVMELLTQASQDQGKALIASMHSIKHVLKYFNRVIGIRKGRLVLDEKVEHLTSEDLEKLYEIQEAEDEKTVHALS